MELRNPSTLSLADDEQLLLQWNKTQTDFPLDRCIHHMFEEQVARTPKNIAVQFGPSTLTYTDLNQRANQLAHHLRTQGVGSEILVGVCLERSIDLIVILLAILKAGGAYVPLDPSYPPDRLKFMLSDAQPKIIVTHSAFSRKFEVYKTGHLICMDTDQHIFNGYSIENPDSGSRANNLAYVIYTSGSTGHPKGVMIEHRGWANYCLSAQYTYDLLPEDRILQFASISWDTSAEEIFPCLTSGSTLILRTADMIDSMRHFLQRCKEWDITVLSLPTAFWHELITQIATENLTIPACIRAVIFGGERALEARLAEWYQFVPRTVRLFNTYGQTECTAVTTCCELLPSLPAGDVPLGKPVHNVRAYLLDDQRQPVSLGETGELYVGGVGVGRGYLGQPEMTNKHFISDPFSGTPGDRLYKTGDLVRFRLDGNLEFVGRVDQQIKLRGIRVEPGEIEAVVLQHPSMQSVVIVGQPAGPTPDYLAAYVVFHADQTLSASELRSWLGERLPDFMIPAIFVSLDSLPLTPNGKVDRRALPIPDFSQTSSNHQHIEPKDELELRLVKLWERLLQRHPISIDDNFFELGGHSLLAVRMITQLEKEFGKPLSLALLFHAPTIEKMAEVLRDQGWQPRWSSLVPIQTGGSRPPLFCVHADGGAFFYTNFTAHLSPDQPLFGIQARGLDGKEAPFTNVKEMAQQYIREIRSVQPKGPYIISGFSMGGVVVYEMAQQLLLNGEPPGLVIFLDAPSPNYPEMLENHNKSVSNKLKKFFDLSATEKLERLITRTSKRWRELHDEILSRLYLLIRRPLPPALRIHVVRKTNQRIADMYQPLPYSGPVTVLRASEQTPGAKPDRTLGWRHYVTGTIDDFVIPGDHETVYQEPNVRLLTQQIQLCIDSWLAKQQTT